MRLESNMTDYSDLDRETLEQLMERYELIATEAMNALTLIKKNGDDCSSYIAKHALNTIFSAYGFNKDDAKTHEKFLLKQKELFIGTLHIVRNSGY